MAFDYYRQYTKAWRKMRFFIGGFLAYAVPRRYCRFRLSGLLDRHYPAEVEENIRRRVAYYNRMPVWNEPLDGVRVADFTYPFGQKKKFSTYFFDLYRCVRHFPSEARFHYVFGDVTDEPQVPSFVKSRPVTAGPTRSVLLKLNSVRHFNFVRDNVPFREKKDRCVSRNIVRQPQRIRLLERYFDHPMCDLGQINHDVQPGRERWIKEWLPIRRQLEYKFICCIEGNDVATNLKWVLSSNSLAVMPKPRYESWFMEGTLVPGYHYVEVKPDYSDLIEKMEYYIAHPEEAEAIIRHGHAYVRQFLDEDVERAVSLLVAREYFRKTNQI